MSSIGQRSGTDPRLLGREAFDVRQLHEDLKTTEKGPAEQKVDEVVQTAPARFRSVVGGAWQRVRGIFRRSSSSSSSGTAQAEEEAKSGSGIADAAEEEPEAESIGDYTASAVNPESYPASLPGDFRILPASAWQSLHARFEQETRESSTEVAATAPANAPPSPTSHHAEGADAADLEKFAQTEIATTPQPSTRRRFHSRKAPTAGIDRSITVAGERLVANLVHGRAAKHLLRPCALTADELLLILGYLVRGCHFAFAMNSRISNAMHACLDILRPRPIFRDVL
ncbi:unnamed protein product [Symbiodinium sp. CCMP2592]|nr:unnamed protein product [Symbiodinium sp. CCMP2592]